MANAFEIKVLQAQPTLYIRKTNPVGDLPQFFGQVYGSVIQHLAAQGVQPAGAAFALYHNMDMQALDIEAGFPVAVETPGKDDIQAGEIPAGKYASGLHIGPYDQMAPFYGALKQWAEDQGYQTVGTAYEWYFSGPEVPLAEARTEVWFPLK